MGVIANFPASVEEAKLIIEEGEFEYTRATGFISTANYSRCVLIGSTAFSGQYEIQSINFSSCITIMERAFQNSLSSISVSFPKCTYISGLGFWSSPIKEGYFNNCTFIGARAFSGCQFLTTISFPQCTYIGEAAFSGCTSLATISFPKCNYIESAAFSNCTSLSSIYFMGSVVVQIADASVFTNTPLVNSTYLGVYGSVYVPSSLLTQYQNNRYWGSGRFFLSRLVGI